MNRFGAFLIHLGISVVIFAGLASLVVFVWYPDFFFASDGGWQGIRIIAAVDLVLGPVLTLVVFNRSKPRAELRRDLTMIGAFQFVCLVAGTYVVYSERPLALVYSDGFFMSMSADDYRELGVEIPDLSAFPGPSPKRVSVVLPDDPAEQSTIRRDAWSKQLPLRALTTRYAPFKVEHIDPQRDAVAMGEVIPRLSSLPDWLASERSDDIFLLRFGSRYQLSYLGVDRQGSIAGVVEFDSARSSGNAGREPPVGPS